MNRHTTLSPARQVAPVPVVQPAGVAPDAPEYGAAPANLVTVDASKVSGRDFLDAITGNSPEKRAEHRQREIERCIRAIQRGDTYGWPPVMVAECRHIMAMRAEVRL